MEDLKLRDLARRGQSLWLDAIDRKLIEGGRLAELVKLGVRGLTSNPAIFHQAISRSDLYDARIARLCGEGRDPFEIYDALSIGDIRDAADILKPVYDRTRGNDGFVSLEIDPRLAEDVEASVKEGLRLHRTVDRPNLMIKVPATPAGFEVVERLIAEGVPVNVTLIFSPAQYVEAVHAYLRGLERIAAGTPDRLSRVRSVASVFISRLDSAVDPLLEKRAAEDPDRADRWNALLGRAATANAAFIYAAFRDLCRSGRFHALAEHGAAPQRVLWASTSTKNPAYSDVKYVTELIAAETVNTVPLTTLDAFLDHGEVRCALGDDASEACRVLDALKDAGIDVAGICRRLLDEGIAAFVRAFEGLLDAVEAKGARLCPS